LKPHWCKGDYIWSCIAKEGFETCSTKTKPDSTGIYDKKGQLHDDKEHTNRMYMMKDAFNATDDFDNTEVVKNLIIANLDKKDDLEETKQYIQRTCETYYNEQMLTMSKKKEHL